MKGRNGRISPQKKRKKRKKRQERKIKPRLGVARGVAQLGEDLHALGTGVARHDVLLEQAPDILPSFRRLVSIRVSSFFVCVGGGVVSPPRQRVF